MDVQETLSVLFNFGVLIYLFVYTYLNKLSVCVCTFSIHFKTAWLILITLFSMAIWQFRLILGRFKAGEVVPNQCHCCCLSLYSHVPRLNGFPLKWINKCYKNFNQNNLLTVSILMFLWKKNNLIWGYGNMFEGEALRVQEAWVLQ